jgi:hypothetical protein
MKNQNKLKNKYHGILRKAFFEQSNIHRAEKFLGCSIQEARLIFESKFTPRMNWDNNGRFTWHIDHIIPCSLFNLEYYAQVKECFNIHNLQPLWWDQHYEKDNKGNWFHYNKGEYNERTSE